jgi:hypothetical protein
MSREAFQILRPDDFPLWALLAPGRMTRHFFVGGFRARALQAVKQSTTGPYGLPIVAPGHECLVPAICALDPRFLADAADPFVAACRRVAGLIGTVCREIKRMQRIPFERFD